MFDKLIRSFLLHITKDGSVDAKCDHHKMMVGTCVRAYLNLDVQGACVRRKTQSQSTLPSLIVSSFFQRLGCHIKLPMHKKRLYEIQLSPFLWVGIKNFSRDEECNKAPCNFFPSYSPRLRCLIKLPMIKKKYMKFNHLLSCE